MIVVTVSTRPDLLLFQPGSSGPTFRNTLYRLSAAPALYEKCIEYSCPSQLLTVKDCP